MMHNAGMKDSVNMAAALSIDLASARQNNSQTLKKPAQAAGASTTRTTNDLNGSLPDLLAPSSIKRGTWNANASTANASNNNLGFATYGSLLYPKYEFDPWTKSRLYSRYKTLGSGLNQHSATVNASVNLPKIRVKRKILAASNGSTAAPSGNAAFHADDNYHQNVHAAFSTQTIAQPPAAANSSVKKTRVLISDRTQKPIYAVANAAANANNLAAATNSSGNTHAIGTAPNRMLVEEVSPLPERSSGVNRTQMSTEADHSPISDKPPTFPLTPAAVVAAFGGRMTNYEKEEIQMYKQVWFVGTENAKKVDANKAKPSNYGYDDDHGYYVVVIHDHISYRYEILEILGRGSFGQVVKALDHQTGKLVAVKLIRNRKRLHQQAQVEITILTNMKAKDPTGSNGFVIMQDSFQFRNHFCIVFELLSSNLYELMRHNHFQGFNINLIREIAVAILQCMRFLYKEKIIHCDLKPENIMFCSSGNCLVKVIDFGSSCYESQRVYTYIQSRFYRSPEVILGIPYTTGIDMWSFGCIMGELYTGSPLLCGENESEHLAIIMEIFGKPPKSMLEVASRKHLFFDSKGEAKYIMDSYGHLRIPNSRSLNSAIATSDYAFLDFVSKCLTLDPTQRMTPDEAFHHPWIQQLFQSGKHSRRLKRERVRGSNPQVLTALTQEPSSDKEKEKENAVPKEEKADSSKATSQHTKS